MTPGVDQFITFLRTDDLAATCRFYEDLLGLKRVLDQAGCVIFQTAGTAYVGFCERGDVPQPPERIVLTLVTDEVDAWHERLAAAGASTDGAPRLNSDYGIYHFFAADPNGYMVEVQRFEDPRWAAHLAD